MSRFVSLFPCFGLVACASGPPARWAPNLDFHAVTATAEVDALRDAHGDDFQTLRAFGGPWVMAGEYHGGDINSIEWYGEDFVMAQPRWAQPSAAFQLEQFGVAEPTCVATLFRQHDLQMSKNSDLPQQERLCWTEDKELLLTRHLDRAGPQDSFERFIWLHKPNLPPDPTVPEGALTLDAIKRPICQGCNMGAGGAFYIHDTALEAWKSQVGEAGVRAERATLLGQADWFDLDEAIALAEKRAKDTADDFERSPAGGARRSVLYHLDSLARLEGKPILDKLSTYLLLARALEARELGDISDLQAQLALTGETIEREVTAELQEAERESRSATAAFLRIVLYRLQGGAVPASVELGGALQTQGEGPVERSRREIARWVSEFLPAVSGAEARHAYASAASKDFGVHVDDRQIAALDGPRAQWRLDVTKIWRAERQLAAREITVNVDNSGEVVGWQGQLTHLRGQIEFHRLAIAQLYQSMGEGGGGGSSGDWGYHQETLTLGSPPYQTQITVARRNSTTSPPSSVPAYQLELIEENERKLAGFIQEYERVASAAPRVQTTTRREDARTVFTGPAERTVRLMIDGETRTLAQSVPSDVEDQQVPLSTLHTLIDELQGFLTSEVRATVRPKLLTHLDRLGWSHWTEEERTIELELLESILIVRGGRLQEPFGYRALTSLAGAENDHREGSM